MEIGESLGHLTKNEHLLVERELRLAVAFVVPAQTGAHSLHEHGQARICV